MCDFGDVYQSVESRLQFYECAVFLDLNDFAFDDLSDFVLLVDDAPWLRRILLETQRDLFFFFVHGEDLDIDLLADGEHFLRVFELAPGNL